MALTGISAPQKVEKKNKLALALNMLMDMGGMAGGMMGGGKGGESNMATVQQPKK